MVAQGINPYEHRKQQRRSVRNAAEHTFDAMFDQWVAFRRLSLEEGRQSTLSQILRVFKKDVLPMLGRRSTRFSSALSTAMFHRAWSLILVLFKRVKKHEQVELRI